MDKWLKIQHRGNRALQVLEFQVWQFCRDYAKSPGDGRRLILHGPNGTGKTHAARAIQSWAQKTALLLPLTNVQTEDGDSIQLASAQFLFWPKVVDKFKQGEWGIIDDAAEQSLVVIDDIGAEHDPSGIGREKLFYILERRATRWTVLTTNCPPDQWGTKFEHRIASRFLRNCTAIDLSGVEDFGTLT